MGYEKIFMVFIQIWISFEHIYGSTVYQDLIGNIFKDYDAGVRPVFDPNTAVDVKLRFGVVQLLDVVRVLIYKSLQAITNDCKYLQVVKSLVTVTSGK